MKTALVSLVVAVALAAGLVLALRHELKEGAEGHIYQHDRLTGRVSLIVRDRMYPVQEQPEEEEIQPILLQVLQKHEYPPSDSFPRGLVIEWKLSGAYRFNTHGQREWQVLWRIATGEPQTEKSKDKRGEPITIGLRMYDAEGFAIYTMPDALQQRPVGVEGDSRAWTAGGDFWVLDQVVRQTESVAPIWRGLH